MNDALTDKIKEYFKDKDEVVAVYLFGSHARGKETPSSDLDIGALLDEDRRKDLSFENKRYDYMAGLSRVTRKDAHPVILNSAGEILMKQIFLKGKCLLVRNPAKLARYKMVMFSRISDFGYYHRKMKEGFAKKIMGSGK
jgi:uncharacterized protein